jgi:hypothetical protein
MLTRLEHLLRHAESRHCSYLYFTAHAPPHEEPGKSAEAVGPAATEVTAVAGSIVLQVVVVYVPFLQRAFGTVGLTARDWTFCIAVASSVLWLREGTKLFGRTTE